MKLNLSQRPYIALPRVCLSEAGCSFKVQFKMALSFISRVWAYMHGQKGWNKQQLPRRENMETNMGSCLHTDIVLFTNSNGQDYQDCFLFFEFGREEVAAETCACLLIFCGLPITRRFKLLLNSTKRQQKGNDRWKRYGPAAEPFTAMFSLRVEGFCRKKACKYRSKINNVWWNSNPNTPGYLFSLETLGKKVKQLLK